MSNGSIATINGPNLSMLEFRDPKTYKNPERVSLGQIESSLKGYARQKEYVIVWHQFEGEGDIISTIHGAIKNPRIRGIIINAGGYSHTSIAIRDALEIAQFNGKPTVEVHLSDVMKREKFRHTLLFKDVCIGSICGQGPAGYLRAFDMLVAHLNTMPE